jgi:hypothetical protein
MDRSNWKFGKTHINILVVTLAPWHAPGHPPLAGVYRVQEEGAARLCSGS